MISAFYNRNPHPYRCQRLLWLGVAWLFLVACGRQTGTTADNLLFSDAFVAGESGDWLIEGDANGRSHISNQQLILELNASNIMQFTTLQEVTLQDFILDVEARPLSGDLGNSYGVLFRMQDSQRFYRFELTADGKYMLERRNGDGSWTRFIPDWTAHPAIVPGHSNKNQIRIEAIGAVMSAYVNDVLIIQITDNSYSSGQIALDAGTFIAPNMEVAFDNVHIYQP